MDSSLRNTTQARSKTLYRGGLIVSVLFLGVSQIILSVVIPASGAVPPASTVTTGSALTFIGFLGVLAMVYSMLLRRRGQ